MKRAESKTLEDTPRHLFASKETSSPHGHYHYGPTVTAPHNTGPCHHQLCNTTTALLRPHPRCHQDLASSGQFLGTTAPPSPRDQTPPPTPLTIHNYRKAIEESFPDTDINRRLPFRKDQIRSIAITKQPTVGLSLVTRNTTDSLS